MGAEFIGPVGGRLYLRDLGALLTLQEGVTRTPAPGLGGGDAGGCGSEWVSLGCKV